MVVVIKNITVTEVWLDLLAKTVVGILIVISGILMKEKEIRVKTMEICKQKHF